MQEHQLSEADSGRMVEARPGDLVEVELPEMPSAGYRWVVEGAPGAVLEAVDETSEFVEGRVGAKSTAHFRFRVKAAGTGKIRLHYCRPWEKGDPLKTYEATIKAR